MLRLINNTVYYKSSDTTFRRRIFSIFEGNKKIADCENLTIQLTQIVLLY